MSQSDLPTVIVTGASSGVGLHATKALTDRGWRVITACRDLDKAADAAREPGLPNNQIELIHLDLASLTLVDLA